MDVYEERWDSLNTLYGILTALNISLPESVQWNELRERTSPSAKLPLLEAIHELKIITKNLKSLRCKMKEFEAFQTVSEKDDSSLTSTSNEQDESSSEEEKSLSPRMLFKRAFSARNLRDPHSPPQDKIQRKAMSPREVPKRKQIRKATTPSKNLPSISVPKSLEEARTMQIALNEDLTNITKKTAQIDLDELSSK